MARTETHPRYGCVRSTCTRDHRPTRIRCLREQRVDLGVLSCRRQSGPRVNGFWSVHRSRNDASTSPTANRQVHVVPRRPMARHRRRCRAHHCRRRTSWPADLVGRSVSREGLATYGRGNGRSSLPTRSCGPRPSSYAILPTETPSVLSSRSAASSSDVHRWPSRPVNRGGAASVWPVKCTRRRRRSAAPRDGRTVTGGDDLLASQIEAVSDDLDPSVSFDAGSVDVLGSELDPKSDVHIAHTL